MITFLISVGILAWACITFMVAAWFAYWLAEKVSGIKNVNMMDDGFGAAMILPTYIISWAIMFFFPLIFIAP